MQTTSPTKSNLNPKIVEQKTIQPFLKWPGGKRWFVRDYSHLLPKSFNAYYEPFLGSGAVFFHLQPESAHLGDINPDILAVYLGLKNDWKFVLKSLQHHQRKHSDEHYYKVRGRTPSNILQQASRMIYLNRTCFNGIYRVNVNGEFNVPKGTKDAVVLDTDDFEQVSKLLRNARIHFGDFEKLIDEAKPGDFIFADPPYTVRHNYNGFIKYNEKLFSWFDQERLAKALIRARKRGVKIVCTNANHPSILELYSRKGFHFETVSRYSSISALPEKRRLFEELVIISR